MPSTPRLLFDTGDYPLGTDNVGGIGLRIAELAETLSASRFDVVVYAPDNHNVVHTGNAEVIRADPAAWPRLLAQADVVFTFDLPNRRRLQDVIDSGTLLVTENAPPIEHLEYPRLRSAHGAHEAILHAYHAQLEHSHHFVCRSHVERVTLAANLSVLGRLSTADIDRSPALEHLISMIPVGYGPTSAAVAAASIPTRRRDFVWTGGIWGFLWPELFVEALALCRARGHELSASFLYAQPGADNAQQIAELRARLRKLGLEDHVELIAASLPHDRRDAYIRGACATVCIGRPGIENDTCIRLRARDARLYGVPMIIDGWGATARELEPDGLARVLDRPSAAELAQLLMRVASERPDLRPRARYAYEHTVTGLIRWLTDQATA